MSESVSRRFDGCLPLVFFSHIEMPIDRRIPELLDESFAFFVDQIRDDNLRALACESSRRRIPIPRAAPLISATFPSKRPIDSLVLTPPRTLERSSILA